MNREVIDFSVPQKLSISGFWVQAVLNFWRFLKSLFIIIVYSAISNYQKLLNPEIWWVILGIMGVIFLYSFIYHINFRYWLNFQDGEIILEKGFLNKSKTVIKFENIQQVNLKQNILQQALDIYAMEIESAGSASKEMDIYALEEEVAEQLKFKINEQTLGLVQAHEIDSHSGLDDSGLEMGQEPSNLLFHIPSKQIFLISLFTNYGQGIALFLAFLFSIFEKLSELISLDTFLEKSESLASSITFVSISVIATLFLIMLIPVIINLFKYFIKYYNFSMRREKNGNIMMKYGLFEVNDVLLNKEKVQKVTVSSNPILKKLKLQIITLRQVVTDKKLENSILIIPGATEHNQTQLWEILFKKGSSPTIQTYKPHKNLLLIRLAIVLLIFGLIGLGLYLSHSSLLQYILLAGLFIPIFICQFIYFKNYKFEIREDLLVKKSGIWDITTTHIAIEKIQSLSITQSIFQKRSQTCNLTISTASGIVNVAYLDFEEIKRLSNEILLEIEID